MAQQYAVVDEMGIDNLSFLVDNLGKDAGELQFLRELTQNAIEAIQRADREGCIEIDFEEIDGINKLRITDNGIGMTPEEVRDNINRLSSSGGQQAFNRNFGIGAKITAAVKNPHGVLYRAWKGAVGSQTLLGKVNGRYGRVGWISEDGERVDYWLPLLNSSKPPIVQSSGVSVVLLGQSNDDDTTLPPEGADVPSQWIAAYLERRYFSLPDGIHVRVRRSAPIFDSTKDTHRAIYDTIRGQRYYLDKHSSASGFVGLPEHRARVLWWLLNSEIQDGGKTWDNRGHVAAVYQNELYEPRRGNARFSALKDFGIYAGHARIVVYVESEDVLGANASRSSLILEGGRALDYSALGAAFASRMPDELALFMAGQVTAEESDHRKAILKNLKEVDQALALSRLCRSPSGGHDVPVEAEAGGRAAFGDVVRGPNRSSRKDQSAGGRLGEGYFRRARAEAEVLRVREVEDDPLPKIVWDPTGEAVPEGRAATYTPARHVVTVNGRFWFYEDLKACCVRESATRRAVGTAESVIAAVAEAIVKRWFEEALVQTVVSLRGMATHPAWGPKVFDTALSDEGLTAAVLSHRWLLLSQVRRELGVRLGRLKEHAA
jgi:Histidine kinase-, DNA gyrase B-, and HSP90-like ATPase